MAYLRSCTSRLVSLLSQAGGTLSAHQSCASPLAISSTAPACLAGVHHVQYLRFLGVSFRVKVRARSKAYLALFGQSCAGKKPQELGRAGE